jgi:hypothetical protein
VPNYFLVNKKITPPAKGPVVFIFIFIIILKLPMTLILASDVAFDVFNETHVIDG